MFLLALAVAHPGLAQTKIAGKAEAFHPQIKWSGRVNAIAQHPDNPSNVIISNERGGLHRSRDGGRTWARIDAFPAPNANDVMFHPADPNLVIATAERDFQNFNVIPVGLGPRGVQPADQEQVDPSRLQPRNLQLAPGGAQQVDPERVAPSDRGAGQADPEQLEQAGSDPQASPSPGQVDLGGATQSTPTTPGGAVPAPPGSASVIPVEASGGGIWISRDAGATWSRPASAVPLAARSFANVRTCPPRYSARDIAVDLDGDIYVGTDCGVAISTDRGLTWTHEVVAGLTPGRAINAIAPLVGGDILAGSRNGVFWSVDGGQNWTRDGTAPLTTENVLFTNSIAAAPVDGAAFVATREGLFYVNRQSGTPAWRALKTPQPPGAAGGQAFVLVLEVESTPPPGATPLKETVAVFYGNGYHGYGQFATIDQSGNLDFVDNIGNRAELFDVHDDFRALLPARVSAVSEGATPVDWDAWYRLNDDGAVLRGGAQTDPTFNIENLVTFLGNDGGLEVDPKILGVSGTDPRTTVGSGGAGKINALQITEVKGQIIADINAHHVYFTTQDNDIWASADAGRTWTASKSAEGFGLDLRRRVATESDAKITYTRCARCTTQISDAQYANEKDWEDPFPDAGNNPDHGYPIRLNNGARISRDNDAGVGDTIKWTTKATGGDWKLLVNITGGSIRDSFHVSTDTFYFQLNGATVSFPFYYGSENVTQRALARVRWPKTTDTATIAYPAMRYQDRTTTTGTTSLSRMPTVWANYGVFDVDPAAPMHLIAPDNQNRVMVHSYDGGGVWSPLLRLSELMIDSGRYSFVDESHEGPSFRWHWPLASAVSFFPDDPNLVMVGARQGGVYVSADRGIGWVRVAGSEKIAEATSIYWLSADEALVGTYGYGLWKIRLNRWTQISAQVDDAGAPKLACLAPGGGEACAFLPYNGAAFGAAMPLSGAAVQGRNFFDALWLVQNGEIIGADGSGGLLASLSVSAGASVVSAHADALGDAAAAERRQWLDGLLTQEPRAGFDGLPALAALAEQGRIVGLATGGRELVGAVIASGPLSPTLVELPLSEGEASDAPPLAGVAHFYLDAPRMLGGLPAAQSGDTVMLTLYHFDEDAPVEIVVDGVIFDQIDARARRARRPGPWVLRRTARNGARAFELPVANLPGAVTDTMHGVLVRQTAGGETAEYLDHFLTMHEDAREESDN